MTKSKYCVDCGNSFDPNSPGASDIRDAKCNRSQKEGFSDIIKYNQFKKDLLKPSSFSDDDEAVEYYHTQLDTLLKMANRSLDLLLAENSTSNFPSQEAELAKLVVDYLEQVQGI